MTGPAVLTLGVEEEFQVLAADSLELVSKGPAVLAAAPPGLAPERLQGELPLSQVEAVTPVCTSLGEAAAQVAGLRRAAARAAADVGCALAAVGLPPVGDWRAQQVSPDPVYAPLRADRGRLVDEQLLAGLHVHVGVPDRDDAARALDGCRVWLPILLALSASSPFWEGEDTGFASWRAVQWARWPVSGPPPAVGDAAGWDAAVKRQVSTGVAAQPSQVYWDLRLSSRYPTLEFRVCDSSPSRELVLALAGLCVALVDTALLASGNDAEPHDPPPDLLRAATWWAARRGLSGTLVDVASGGRLPAAAAVDALLAHVRPALLARELDAVDGPVLGPVLEQVRAGGAVARLRAAASEGGVRAAAAWAVAETLR